MFDEKQISSLLKSARFAAEKHQHQRRKGASALPYINHPIQVAELLWDVGQVRDSNVLLAAVLHDTIEDTATTPDEIEKLFGKEVLALVQEVTDDKRLKDAERKRLQMEHAPHLSPGAKQIKLADKISNLQDLTQDPPKDWSLQRLTDYANWSEKVVAGLRGANPNLERLYDHVLRRIRAKLLKRETE